MILDRTFIHTWASIYMRLLSMLHEGSGRYCMPRWPDCGACTSAHCKLLMLNYWNVAEEGSLNYGGGEVWEAQRSKGMPVWKHWGSYSVKLETFFFFTCCYLSFRAWKYNELLVLPLSESLSVSDSDRMPWDYYCIICEQVGGEWRTRARTE